LIIIESKECVCVCVYVWFFFLRHILKHTLVKKKKDEMIDRKSEREKNVSYTFSKLKKKNFQHTELYLQFHERKVMH
jgi:hypothetical protein